LGLIKDTLDEVTAETKGFGDLIEKKVSQDISSQSIRRVMSHTLF
jgi:hypothetical protein